MRLAGLTLVAFLVLAGPALTHPGHGPTIVSVSGFQYRPNEAHVTTGDSVLWFWDGNDRNHSVTADPGQAESFDSDPGRTPTAVDHPPNDRIGHQFRRPGTFTYHCKVHSFMRGSVVVTGDPVPDPDTAAPRVSKLRLGGGPFCARGGCASRARLRFTLDEAAGVVARITPVGGKGPRRTSRFSARMGANSVGIRVRGLRPGRYRLSLTLVDAAGNEAEPRLLAFTMRSRKPRR